MHVLDTYTYITHSLIIAMVQSYVPINPCCTISPQAPLAEPPLSTT